MSDTRWRAIPYAEMDATQDKDLMFFGDPSDEIAVAEYRARVRRLVYGDGPPPPPRLPLGDD